VRDAETREVRGMTPLGLYGAKTYT